MQLACVFAETDIVGLPHQGRHEEFATSMQRLNMYASGVLEKFEVSAMTDVTGFGLLGHALPIARNAGVTLVFHASLLPCFESTFALMDESPSAHKIKSDQHVEPHTMRSDAVSGTQFRLMTDPQTSGGLLAAVGSDRVHEVVHALHEAGDTAARQVGEVIPLMQSPEGRPVFLKLEGLQIRCPGLKNPGGGFDPHPSPLS